MDICFEVPSHLNSIVEIRNKNDKSGQIINRTSAKEQMFAHFQHSEMIKNRLEKA